MRKLILTALFITFLLTSCGNHWTEIEKKEEVEFQKEKLER
jgi:hypothetical protein